MRAATASVFGCGAALLLAACGGGGHDGLQRKPHSARPSVTVAPPAVTGAPSPMQTETAPSSKLPAVSGNLTGRRLFTDTLLGRPAALAVVGSTLWIANRGGGPAMFVIDRRTGRKLTAFGRDGEGPGEFRSMWDLATGGPLVHGRPAVWLYDAALRRLTPAVWPGSGPDSDVAYGRSVSLSEAGFVTGVVWRDSSHMLAIGITDSGRLARFTADGHLAGYVGQLPPNPARVPVQVLQHAYHAYLAARPDRSRFVAVDHYAGSIELFDAQGHSIGRREGPVPFQPRFTVASAAGRPVFASDDDLRFGYVAVAATQGRIYAVFSGRRRGDYPGTAVYGDRLHIFDWDGHLISTAHLSTPTTGIAVDPGDSVAYVLVDDPEPSVYAYELRRGDSR